MRLPIWIVLFVSAEIISYLALTRRIDERLGGIVATVVWGVAMYGAFDLSSLHATDTGVETISNSNIALVFLCFIGLAVMGAFFLSAVSGQLEPREATRFGDRS